ncbi:MAG: hypothetical protein IPK79_12610 [Vampirovibrionales bacterium]|nr:hypothetical protein [Vampirovibrionales bacterium]
MAVHELGHIIGDAASGQRNVGLMLKRFGDADGAIYRPAHQSPQTYEEILRGIVTMVSGWAFSQHFSRASGGDDDQQLMDGTTYRQILQSTSDVNSILSLLSSAKSKRFLDVDPADLAPLNQRGMVEIMRPLNHGVETEFTPLATQLADIVSQSYQTFRLPVVSRAILTSKLLFGTIPPEAFQAMVGEAVARRVISPEEMPAFLDRHLTPEVQQRLTGIMDAYVADAMQRFMPIKPD